MSPFLAENFPVLEFREADHTYWMQGRRVLGVTEIIKDNGFSDFSMIPEATLEHARQRGQDVHTARHLLDAGRLDWSTVSEEIGAYLESYLAWRQHYPGHVVCGETPHYHRVYRYAGTPDLVYQFEERPHPRIGARPLLDVKCGGDMPGHELQTAAYEAAYNMNARALERATGRGALYLRKDGRVAELVPHLEHTDLKAFLACQQLTEWRKHHD